mgnify:CR=1 FL=1
MNYIHRDIKPDNFLIGNSRNQSTVYIIDFGLAKRFRDPRNGNHIQWSEKKALTGTPRYASLNAHQGIEQSRRDDLQSIGIVIIYFLKGSLPWQGLHGKNKDDKFEKMKIKKIETSTEELCKDLPKQIFKYQDYVTNLKFNEEPDYAWIRKNFKDLMKEKNHETDCMFDWLKKKIEIPIPLEDYADYVEVKPTPE